MLVAREVRRLEGVHSTHIHAHTLIDRNGNLKGGVLEWAPIRQSRFQILETGQGQILDQQNQVPLGVDGLRTAGALQLQEVIVDDLVTFTAGEVLQQHLKGQSAKRSKRQR